ncbi:cytochrome P450 [Rhizoclosmatium globosum]|uniref:Cytochrome P450 n=1 Tax=Rhizoclosmatium globosum TaxID=329046 RepID=A0A1Y2D1E7_9FUNG|nr:cytochrome P450 [Rhizoclosmatium globosum]|eukprot:ORY53123.1 cytochrome P450 [Rhizoclosmatium globosum]
MPNLITTALSTLTVVLVTTLYFKTSIRRPPVAANGIPFLNHVLVFMKGQYFLGDMFQGLENENAVEGAVMGRRMYVVRGGENVRAVLGSSQLKMRGTGESSGGRLEKLRTLNTGLLFNSNVASWKQHRKLLVENIGRPRFIKSLIPKLNEYMNSLTPVLDELADTLDVIMDVIFSEERNAAYQYVKDTLGSNDGEYPECDTMITTIHKFMDAQKYFTSTPPFLFNYVKLKETRMHDASVDTFEKVITQRVHEKLESLQQEPQNTTNELDLASALLLDPSPEMTPDRVISVIKEAVFGGQDTSSNTLAFILYELSRNPSIADAVHAEIADLQGPITETNISRLKLVEAVIHETSRLYNVAPTAIRYLSEDDGFVFVLMCENHLRAGREEEVGPSGFGWNFAPFGYGVRKCPGESLALLEMKMVVAHLCKRYKFRLATDEPVKIKETFRRV